mgnify:CR=1 FL=1
MTQENYSFFDFRDVVLLVSFLNDATTEWTEIISRKLWQIKSVDPAQKNRNYVLPSVFNPINWQGGSRLHQHQLPSFVNRTHTGN